MAGRCTTVHGNELEGNRAAGDKIPNCGMSRILDNSVQTCYNGSSFEQKMYAPLAASSELYGTARAAGVPW